MGFVKRVGLPLAAVVAAAVVASGCGSESGGGGTVVVGVASPLSGEAAVWGEPVDRVTRAAVNEINDAGGINGTKLTVVTEDEKFNPEDGVRVVNKLVNKDNAQFITGVTSGTLMATLGFAKRNRVVIASPYSGIVDYDDKGQGDYTFRTVGPDSFDGLTVASNFRDMGLNRIAILAENNDSALSTAGYAKDFFEKLGGQVVDVVKFNAAQSSYLAEVRKAFANSPEGIFLAASGESAQPILREAYRLGLKAKWSVLAELTTDQFVKAAGPDIMEGVYGQQTVAATGNAAYQHMADVLKKNYPGKEGEDLVGTVAVPQDYDAIIVAALAMAAGGKASADAINENYRKVGDPPGVKVTSFAEGVKQLAAGKDIDYEGASGPLDFNETGTAAPDYGIYQVRNGKYELVKKYPAIELFKTIKSM